MHTFVYALVYIPNKLPYYREVRLTPEGVQVGSVHVTVGSD